MAQLLLSHLDTDVVWMMNDDDGDDGKAMSSVTHSPCSAGMAQSLHTNLNVDIVSVLSFN